MRICRGSSFSLFEPFVFKRVTPTSRHASMWRRPVTHAKGSDGADRIELFRPSSALLAPTPIRLIALHKYSGTIFLPSSYTVPSNRKGVFCGGHSVVFFSRRLAGRSSYNGVMLPCIYTAVSYTHLTLPTTPYV